MLKDEEKKWVNRNKVRKREMGKEKSKYGLRKRKEKD